MRFVPLGPIQFKADIETLKAMDFPIIPVLKGREELDLPRENRADDGLVPQYVPVL